MSKNLDRYWQIEYQLQMLWNIPHEARDYKLISRLTAEQSKVRDTLGDKELMVMEDSALTSH
jgi:hypothetical protein